MESNKVEWWVIVWCRSACSSLKLVDQINRAASEELGRVKMGLFYHHVLGGGESQYEQHQDAVFPTI
jgi:hypothetical protein